MYFYTKSKSALALTDSDNLNYAWGVKVVCLEVLFSVRNASDISWAFTMFLTYEVKRILSSSFIFVRTDLTLK